MAGSFDMRKVLICIAIMALVTYAIRVLPLTVFHRQIKSRYIRSFLDYTPYAVLGAMTFPDVFFSTGSLISAVAGTAVALILSYQRRGLVTVACAAIAVVFLVEMIL